VLSNDQGVWCEINQNEAEGVTMNVTFMVTMDDMAQTDGK
jgi:hypothetical protein